MFFEDSLFMPYDDDSRSRGSTGPSRETQPYASPKDSTRQNDYDMGFIGAAMQGSPLDSSVRAASKWSSPGSFGQPESQGSQTSLGFDRYIRAIAKPPQQPPAMPPPPESETVKDIFAFGLQSFLRTVEPSHVRSAEGRSSSSTVASSSGRYRAKSHSVSSTSPNDPIELSMSSVSSQRRGAGNRTTPASRRLAAATTAAAATPTAASPTLMGHGYLDGFLDATEDRQPRRQSRRPQATGQRRLYTAQTSSTDTEPFSPFLDAADAAEKALQDSHFDSSRRSSSTRSERASNGVSRLATKTATPPQGSPATSVRRSSRRPSVNGQKVAAPPHEGRGRSPAPAAVVSSPVDRRPHVTQMNTQDVLEMIAENPVAAAVRSTPGTPFTLLPPVSPTSSGHGRTRRVNDTNHFGESSDHGTATSGAGSGSLPALTPRTSSAVVSPGSGSVTSDNTTGSSAESVPGGSAHRRMSRPRPTSASFKQQQGTSTVALPDNRVVGVQDSVAPARSSPRDVQTTPLATRRLSPKASQSATPAMPLPSTTVKATTPVLRKTRASPSSTPAQRAASFTVPPRGLSANSGSDRRMPVKLPPSLRKTPLPLQKAPPGILSHFRLFDLKTNTARVRRARGEPRRSLPNGKRRADWTPPVTNYTATIHDWCGDSDDDDEVSGEDVDIDAPPTPQVRVSLPGAIMVDEVDKKRLIASEEGSLTSPQQRALRLSQNHERHGSAQDVVRVSRSFDLSGTPLTPTFFKASPSGSDMSPPPSRSSRRTQTPITRPVPTPLSLTTDGVPGGQSPSPLPQVTFAADVEDIPF